MLTGVRPGGYSVSVNYRRTELGAQNGISGILTNLKRGVVGHWPVSFLVREVLSSEQTFNIAVGNCDCLPWDFPIIVSKSVTECDVFGRTCFYETIKNATKSNSCAHCKDDCEFIHYHISKFTEKIIQYDNFDSNEATCRQASLSTCI